MTEEEKIKLEKQVNLYCKALAELFGWEDDNKLFIPHASSFIEHERKINEEVKQ